MVQFKYHLVKLARDNSLKFLDSLRSALFFSSSLGVHLQQCVIVRLQCAYNMRLQCAHNMRLQCAHNTVRCAVLYLHCFLRKQHARAGAVVQSQVFVSHEVVDVVRQ